MNNAGVQLAIPIECLSLESIENMYNTNVFGVLRMIRGVLPSMKKHRKGRIVNISSITGLSAFPFNTVYCSTKYAMEGITESLAPELASFNIHVIAVEPGPVLTPLMKNHGKNIENISIDDATKILLNKFDVNLSKIKSACMMPDECAEHIKKAIIDENPQPHYMICKDFEEILKAKYCDLTGRISFENSKKLLE
ncbi:retinol dehydrogenase 8-like [Xenia sp. Carnegie-2017]|uniref:retinol dehydrogenase 8-like n=1 Tax=Xenia sp. Carnegie-2017 TaxID=2897299 RepID=UPI001F04A3B3|nr:retinol dehydrogenase 8-like [Xenia sp. Carnegie-2017]